VVAQPDVNRRTLSMVNMELGSFRGIFSKSHGQRILASSSVAPSIQAALELSITIPIPADESWVLS